MKKSGSKNNTKKTFFYDFLNIQKCLTVNPQKRQNLALHEVLYDTDITKAVIKPSDKVQSH